MLEYDIVVSSENSPYLIWQTQLFCFSAINRLKVRPIIVAHKRGNERLDPAFNALESKGCPVIEAPSFRNHPLGDYPCRNEAGTLFAFSRAMTRPERPILFCEADMLFVRPIHYRSRLSGEYYSYLDYNTPHIIAAARQWGIKASGEDLNAQYSVGVPYLIPVDDMSLIAQNWLAILDSFLKIEWIDLMYAFGLAAANCGFHPITTHMMDTNQDSLSQQTGQLIHYCYGDKLWDKRRYTSGAAPLKTLRPEGSDLTAGSIIAEIRRQIDAADEFFAK